MAGTGDGPLDGPGRDLIDLLAELRVRKGLSFRAIADRIPSTRGDRTSHGYISEVFAGKKVPSGEVAISIVRALGGSAQEQARARGHADAATARRSTSTRGQNAEPAAQFAELTRQLRQQSAAPGIVNVTINQAPADSPGAQHTISIGPPVGLLPRLLHGRTLITSEIIDSIVPEADDAMPPSTNSRSLWVLHGMGGVGKSAIALVVADHCAATGMDVFWVSADDPSRLAGGMREIALRGGDATSAVLGVGSMLDAAWGYLESTENRWLIVFDAADDPSVFMSGTASRSSGAGWIRPSGHGTVLVTSRLGGEEAWGRQARLRKVSPLAAQYGAKIVVDHLDERVRAALQRDSRSGMAAAEALSDRLGGLPLALRAAGRYLMRVGRLRSDRALARDFRGGEGFDASGKQRMVP